MPHILPHILPGLCQLQKRWIALQEHIDIILFNSAYEMVNISAFFMSEDQLRLVQEPITAEVAANAFPKPLLPLCVGPSVDLPPPTTSVINESNPDPVISFLNSAYTDLGQHSVIYIAFGTTFFPLPQSIPHLMIIIDEVLAQGLRVVFALSSDSAKAGGFSADYISKITEGGNVIFPEWTKQLEVLEHPVSIIVCVSEFLIDTSIF
jgi:hypothetical protein